MARTSLPERNSARVRRLSRQARAAGASSQDIRQVECLPPDLQEDALIELAVRHSQDAIQKTLSQAQRHSHGSTQQALLPQAEHGGPWSESVPEEFFAAVKKAGKSRHPGRAMMKVVARGDQAVVEELARMRNRGDTLPSPVCQANPTRTYAVVGAGLNAGLHHEPSLQNQAQASNHSAAHPRSPAYVRVNVRGDQPPAEPLPHAPYYLPSDIDPDYNSCNVHLNESTANYPAWSPRHISPAVLARCRPAPPRNRPASARPDGITPPQFHGPYFQSDVGGLRVPSRGTEHPRDRWDCVLLVGDVRNTWQTVDQQRFGSKIQSDPLESVNPVFLEHGQGGARSIPKELVWLHSGSYRYTGPTNQIVRHMDNRPSAREIASERARGLLLQGCSITSEHSPRFVPGGASASLEGSHTALTSPKGLSQLPQISSPRGPLA
eukprot:COSAG05_NODE_2955_length_2470_cov_2.101266_2_plen_436_part_00